MGQPNLIAIMRRVEPEEVQVLMKTHADFPDVFSDERMLGREDRTRGAKLEKAKAAGREKAMLDLANAGASALKTRIDQLLDLMLAKMRVASRVKFAGAVVAVCSSAVGALFSYFGTTQDLVALTAAIFAMIGGLVTLFADQVVKASSGVALASPEQHGKVIAVRADVERIALRLARATVQPLTTQEVEGLLAKLDDYAVQLIQYERL